MCLERCEGEEMECVLIIRFVDLQIKNNSWTPSSGAADHQLFLPKPAVQRACSVPGIAPDFQRCDDPQGLKARSVGN